MIRPIIFALSMTIAACSGGTAAATSTERPTSRETDPLPKNESRPAQVVFGGCVAVPDLGPSGDVGGWGTVGTGRHGAIGSGSGHGTGSGATGSQAKGPGVSVGKTTATGDLDKNIIRRYIRRTLPQIKYCYEKQLVVDPKLQGKVIAAFVIGIDGTVARTSATGMHPKVSSCIAKAIGTIRFPKPKGGGVVNVRYPFVFESNDSPASSTQPSKPEKAVSPPPEESPEEARETAAEEAEKAGVMGALKQRDSGAFGALAAAEPLDPMEPRCRETVAPLPADAREAVDACHRRALERGAELAGPVLVRFVRRDGSATMVEVSGHGVDGELASCVTRAVSDRMSALEADTAVSCPIGVAHAGAGGTEDVGDWVHAWQAACDQEESRR